MKILRWVAGVIALLIMSFVTTVQLRWDRKFEAPAINMKASTDSALIARGQYLAYGPAHCADCHGNPELQEQRRKGELVPLSGGLEFAFPPGRFRVPNITPDLETGIGRRTDEDLARMIRYAVRHDGRASLPFMEFQKLADEDVTALISFLRSQPPVRHEVPAHEINFLGKTILAFLLKPAPVAGAPPVAAPTGATVERGEYLARSVAGCKDCHTQRSPLDGHYTGPEFGGGSQMPSDVDPTIAFVPPNLTSDPATGRIASWTEDQFVARLRAGRVFEASHMPWEAFARMSADDLRAIYRYLRTVPSVVNNTGPSMQKTEK